MKYKSTRGLNEEVTASQAILNGLAADGGLYIPTQIPRYEITNQRFLNNTYQELAFDIMKPFLEDFSEKELKSCIVQAYDEKFTNELIAPIKKIGSDYYLELFHGPTLAFKDMALSILPYLMTTSLKKQKIKEDVVILTATSGDTGKAAMEGFSDVTHTKIIVFYPKEGVSAIQERQMLTQKGENTFVVGINGNFDEAQTAVKEMFNDKELNQLLANNKLRFSSANSINIGRLVPQIVYYFYAYQQLVLSKEITLGDKINVSVPTGNFGNILAAYYAKKMGLPIETLICASNKNNVLTEFFKTGTYDKNRDFFVTNSPSMDILISSNLERLLATITKGNTQRLNRFMSDLDVQGSYSLEQDEQKELLEFYSGFATESEIETVVKAVFEADKYVIDPHTAVAKKVAEDHQKETNTPLKTVIVSTASPYKFPAVFLGEQVDTDEVEKLHELTGLEIPKSVLELVDLPILHDRVVNVSDMKQSVVSILSL
ncbi:threonine synthase [Vagococcus hydrophili]|uniref:Threonine synthase n=1 Tax=Vagococcus hydrophili TaxID=2714947 RepID=A0A6G8AR84_9ENTE|nr:threonine synthase [Vagococcus hydrophili]QIL47479.1 threonine synthase [Vagococcus hydrophili]